MKTIRLSAPRGTIPRPRSPFTDYCRKPRGGAHVGRKNKLECLLQREHRACLSRNR